jgi:hypothetical protein
MNQRLHTLSAARKSEPAGRRTQLTCALRLRLS